MGGSLVPRGIQDLPVHLSKIYIYTVGRMLTQHPQSQVLNKPGVGVHINNALNSVTILMLINKYLIFSWLILLFSNCNDMFSVVKNAKNSFLTQGLTIAQFGLEPMIILLWSTRC